MLTRARSDVDAREYWASAGVAGLQGPNRRQRFRSVIARAGEIRVPEPTVGSGMEGGLLGLFGFVRWRLRRSNPTRSGSCVGGGRTEVPLVNEDCTQRASGAAPVSARTTTQWWGTYIGINHTRTACALLGVFFLTVLDPRIGEAVVVAADTDTYITQVSGLGGPDSNHASDTQLWCALGFEGGGSPQNVEMPLVRFDLTAFSGTTLAGNATLRLRMTGFNGGAPPQTINTIQAHAIQSPDWSASTVTYNNFFSQLQSTNLDEVTVSPATVGSTVSWTIPQSTVQGWIDDPQSNRGLALRSVTAVDVTDAIFSSLEGESSPQLTFDLVPSASAQLPFTVLLESNEDRGSGAEVFLADFASLDDLVNSAFLSTTFSALNIGPSFDVVGLAFDGAAYHMLLESTEDRGPGVELFYAEFASLGDLDADIVQAQSFSAIDVGNASTIRGFTHDGSGYHILIESDQDRPAGQEVQLVSFAEITNLLDGQSISVAFTGLDIDPNFSIGGFAHDGQVFRVLVESNFDEQAGFEVSYIQFDTLADLIAGTPSLSQFTQLNISSSFRLGGMTVPEPSFGVALAVGLFALAASGRARLARRLATFRFVRRSIAPAESQN